MFGWFGGSPCFREAPVASSPRGKADRTVVNFDLRDPREHHGGFRQVPESFWTGRDGLDIFVERNPMEPMDNSLLFDVYTYYIQYILFIL